MPPVYTSGSYRSPRVLGSLNHDSYVVWLGHHQCSMRFGDHKYLMSFKQLKHCLHLGKHYCYDITVRTRQPQISPMRSSKRDRGEMLECPSISIAGRTHGNKQLFMLTFKKFRTKRETNQSQDGPNHCPSVQPHNSHHRSHVLQLIAVIWPCLEHWFWKTNKSTKQDQHYWHWLCILW